MGRSLTSFLVGARTCGPRALSPRPRRSSPLAAPGSRCEPPVGARRRRPPRRAPQHTRRRSANNAAANICRAPLRTISSNSDEPPEPAPWGTCASRTTLSMGEPSRTSLANAGLIRATDLRSSPGKVHSSPSTPTGSDHAHARRELFRRTARPNPAGPNRPHIDRQPATPACNARSVRSPRARGAGRT